MTLSLEYESGIRGRLRTVSSWATNGGRLGNSPPCAAIDVTIQLFQLGHWGFPLERQDERVEKIFGLFAAGRKAGADDGKGISAGIGAETTGDFLLEFGPSQVAFGLIVVEGNAQVGEEVQGPRCGACAVAE